MTTEEKKNSSMNIGRPQKYSEHILKKIYLDIKYI